MDKTLTYRPWESRWSPNNRAVREAQSMAASDRNVQRHQKRKAEAEARAQAYAEAARTDPAMVQRRRLATQGAGNLSAVMAAPARCRVIAPTRCIVIDPSRCAVIA
jgi:hypothetical protein